HVFSHAPDAQYTNETLALHGFIGVTPDKPVIAFSFKLFEIYHQLHCVCPQFSFHALSTSLAHLHQVTIFFLQLSNAYDCYLEILCVVDGCIQQALAQDEAWQTHHICPPCLYKLKDDHLMKYSMLVAMDGNNLLKLVDSTFCSGTFHTDDHVSSSSRWICPEEVDQFKDEGALLGQPASQAPQIPISAPLAGSSTTLDAHSAPHPLTAELNAANDDILWLNIVEHEGIQKVADVCVQHWQSAGSEAQKKMFALFAITGIFIAVCCHGHLLAICDMIWSRELSSDLPFSPFWMRTDTVSISWQDEIPTSCHQSTL
ncbi:hypothetical protein L208DRAFT_1280109, partial [Tricholoma matsutake]